MDNTSLKHFRALYALVGLLAILTLMLFLTGCGVKTVETSDPGASQDAAPTTQTPPPVNNFAKQFGDTITWEDGSSISVSAPTPFTPSEYAAGVVTGATNVVFEIVYTNNTDEPYEPIMWPSVSSGGVEASSIADIGHELGDIGIVPVTTVLPGQTIKWYQAFSVADPAAITFEISPDSFGEDGLFTNVPF